MSVRDQRLYLKIYREHNSYARRAGLHISYYELCGNQYIMRAAFKKVHNREEGWHSRPIPIKDSMNDSYLSYGAAMTRISKVCTYNIGHVTEEEMEKVYDDYFPMMI